MIYNFGLKILKNELDTIKKREMCQNPSTSANFEHKSAKYIYFFIYISIFRNVLKRASLQRRVLIQYCIDLKATMDLTCHLCWIISRGCVEVSDAVIGLSLFKSSSLNKVIVTMRFSSHKTYLTSSENRHLIYVFSGNCC